MVSPGAVSVGICFMHSPAFMIKSCVPFPPNVQSLLLPVMPVPTEYSQRSGFVSPVGRSMQVSTVLGALIIPEWHFKDRATNERHFDKNVDQTVQTFPN